MRSACTMGALLLLAACGGAEEADTGAARDTSTPPPPPTATQSAADSAGAAMGGGAHLNLMPVQGTSETGLGGMAMLTPRGDQVEIAVTVTGKPDATLQAHVHRGRCGADRGVAMPLTPITTNQDGTGTSTTSVPADTARGEHFVQVHGTGDAPVLCADLPEA